MQKTFDKLKFHRNEKSSNEFTSFLQLNESNCLVVLNIHGIRHSFKCGEKKNSILANVVRSLIEIENVLHSVVIFDLQPWFTIDVPKKLTL